MQQTTESAISVRSVTKRYGATVALDGADFDVHEGEVHALLGENGAGKSTAVKILSGLLEPDSGELVIFGESTRIPSARVAHQLGVQTAFQEMTLIPDLSVTQNMLLPYEPTTGGQIRRGQARARVNEILARLDLGSIDPGAEVRSLDLPVRQKIEIAKAVARRPRILLLDEPTSALSGRDVDWLGSMIRQLREEGVTVIFISHRMPEVRMFCDRLSILRNGRAVGTFDIDDVTDDEVVGHVVGRSIDTQVMRRREPEAMAEAPVILSGEGLATARRLEDLPFELHSGEILGVSALQGMGQLELFMSLFGMEDLTDGQIRLDGKPVTITSPIDAVRNRIGISLLPEDRKTEALFQHLPGTQNVSLPVVDRFATLGWVDTEAEKRAVDQALARVNVHPRALYKAVSSFSGGNQQKIALAKWLLARSRILLMFDPTRGVDVGTKEEIYDLMRQFADEGGAILFYSTEIPELVNLCDRVLTIYRGRVADTLAGDDITEANIARSVIGHEGIARHSEAVA